MAKIYVLTGTVDSGQKLQEIRNSNDVNWCDLNLVHI